MGEGVPCLGLEPDGGHYVDLHRGHADTIDPAALHENAAALARMAHLIAEQ